MPVHVEKMTSEVTVFDGDLPLSEEQIETLICRVMDRLQEHKREARQVQESTGMRAEATPPIWAND